MKSAKYTTEYSSGVLTVRIGPASVLQRRLFIAGTVMWVLATLIQIALLIVALATQMHLREALIRFPSPHLPVFLLLIFATGSVPWRCEFDAKKDKITIDGWRKIPLATVTAARIVHPNIRIGTRSNRVRHLNLGTAAGRDITIRSAMVRGEEDEAKLEEVVLTINQFLRDRPEHGNA